MARKKKSEEPATVTEHARVTAAGEESLKSRGKERETPPDIKDYSGRYIETATGEEFGHKNVPDDARGHTHHLKNEIHFHAVNEEDFKKLFEKKYL